MEEDDGYEPRSFKEAMMPQVAQLTLYLDLRCRILAHEFEPGERLTASTFSDVGLTRHATLGVLHALATGGYLNKHHNYYTRTVWTADSLLECTDRLGVFVEICAARVVSERGVRLQRLQDLAVLMAAADPADEAYFLHAIDWVSLLLEAGERRAISEVAYKLIPQAYYRILWNLVTSNSSLRSVVQAISRHNVEALGGDVSLLRDRQTGVYANLRRAIAIGLRANPSLRFDRDDLAARNLVREADVRGRTLALTHPPYPLFLGIERAPATALPIVVQ
jgi:DNA-binding GntR family transcriptional regulator